MFNFSMPLCICSRVGCTSRSVMPSSFMLATAAVSCLKTLSVLKTLISVLQNCFQVLMWSGASVLKTNVDTSRSITGVAVNFMMLGWLSREYCSIIVEITFFSWTSSVKSIIVSKCNLPVFVSHSMAISPSVFEEYKISGLQSSRQEESIFGLVGKSKSCKIC